MRWLAVVTMGVALAACQPRELEVEDAWVRLPAVPGRPAAAYFDLEGGGLDATLIGASSTAARRAELHETVANGMRPVASVVVKSGEEIAFAPAGRHVMLYDVDTAVKPGGTMPLRLDFEDGKFVNVEAKVIGAADPAP